MSDAGKCSFILVLVDEEKRKGSVGEKLAEYKSVITAYGECGTSLNVLVDRDKLTVAKEIAVLVGYTSYVATHDKGSLEHTPYAELNSVRAFSTECASFTALEQSGVVSLTLHTDGHHIHVVEAAGSA